MGFIPDPVPAEKYVNGKWVDVDFKEIHVNDIFRIYTDATKTTIAEDEEGNTVFKARRDARTLTGFDYIVDSEPVIGFEG